VRCAKHCAVCERDLEKPKQRACMKCAGLKEKCKLPEVGGPGPVVDKGKGKAKEKEAKEKEAATSLQGGEKRKKKTVKVDDDDDKIVEVAGPSGSRSGFNTSPFLEQMDRLMATVEAMTGQMAQIADSTRSVSWSNDHLSAGLETFFEECQFLHRSSSRRRRKVRGRSIQRRLTRSWRSSRRTWRSRKVLHRSR